MRALTLTTILLVMALVSSCSKKEKTIPFGTKTTEVILNIEGMYCGGCEFSVKKALMKLNGVVKAEADHKSGKAWVTVVEGEVKQDDLVGAITKIGYKAKIQKEEEQ